MINQREVGQDVNDFEIGMKHAVREDPDIILVGEFRDEETFMTAIHAAETGHLVFGTIHASSAATTIGRILDLFPEEMHGAIRSAIAFNMKGIVAQKLLKSIRPGVSRVPTCEVMTFSPMIRKLVLEGHDNKLPDAIRIGEEDGMQDFTMSLKQLIDDELIDRPTAFAVAPNKDAVEDGPEGNRRESTRNSVNQQFVFGTQFFSTRASVEATINPIWQKSLKKRFNCGKQSNPSSSSRKSRQRRKLKHC